MNLFPVRYDIAAEALGMAVPGDRRPNLVVPYPNATYNAAAEAEKLLTIPKDTYEEDVATSLVDDPAFDDLDYVEAIERAYELVHANPDLMALGLRMKLDPAFVGQMLLANKTSVLA